MAVPENVLTDIRRIVFSNHEPYPPYKVMWAKKNEENTFNYYVFNDGKWNDVSSYVIPEVSAYLSAFINDVGFVTEEAIEGKQDVIVDLDEIRAGAAAGATAYQKSQSGIPKTDLASDVQQSLNSIANKEDKVEIVSVESGTTAITTAVGKYYSVAGSVGILAITLPSASDTSHLQSVVISLTAGSSPNVSFISADSAAISYFRGYEILANTSYEINCLFNGTKWIIGYAIID